jgi:signal transduction histidine kinase
MDDLQVLFRELQVRYMELRTQNEELRAAQARLTRETSQRKALEREAAEAEANERRRIGRELHDDIGGKLTGMGFSLQSLTDDLKAKSLPEAADAARLAERFDHLFQQVHMVCRGLNPVEQDRYGLTAALGELAARTAQCYGVACDFQSDEAAGVEDNHLVACHLFRIAQEAVTNALRRGRPTRIALRLRTEGRRLTLQVTDDGLDVPDQDAEAAGDEIRKMRYRAERIGAELQMQRRNEGGVIVACTLTR